MNYKKIAMSVILLLLGLCELKAQKTISASGGEAT
jgi:hypothetical protein